MGIISKPNDFSPGSTAKSSEVNDNFDTIYNDYNGNIAAANLADNAVTTSKIADTNVTTNKLADASVTTAKLAAASVIDAKLSITATSQANAGTAGGTMYYINLGGTRILWGVSAANSLTNTSSATYTWTLPTSFFSTIQVAFPVNYVPGSATNAAINTVLSTATTTTITTRLTNQTGGTQSISHAILILGT